MAEYDAGVLLGDPVADGIILAILGVKGKFRVFRIAVYSQT